MGNILESLIRNWAENDLVLVNLRIAHMERRLYKTYEPNKFGPFDFWDRLERWLSNVSDDEKKTLLRLVNGIFYLGPDEFEELYRCAYQGVIAKWLIDSEGIDVCAPGADLKIAEAVRQTWFCPVTDSFRINAFFHINNIQTQANLRPDWHSLLEFSDPQKIEEYCKLNKIKRLVLLEDFVGGGSQSLAAVEFAATRIGGLNVLFSPLIICPTGAKNARNMMEKLNRNRVGALTYAAVSEVPSEAFFTPTSSPFDSPEQTQNLRELLNSSYPAVSGGVPVGVLKPYHPYGFPHQDPTGGLIVMYSNTPDNTLPIIHWSPPSGSWFPVFPRHSRV